MTAQNLAPDMVDAEVITATVIFRLCTGTEIRCDPSNAASLDTAQAAIIDAAVRAGIDGRVMFTAARRQLGDIEATRASLAAAGL